MTKSQITKQQHTILTHLYHYRFLNRTQIQSFLNHKTHNRINSWLKDLYENNYVERIYSSNFGENTKPAIYSIGPNGIRFLKTQANLPPEQVRKLYREADRTENFISRCQLLADICLTLRGASSTTPNAKTTYTFATAAEIADAENELHLLQHMKLQLIVTKHESPSSQTYSIIEAFDPTLPSHAIRNRLRAFLGFYDAGDWEDRIDAPFPSLLMISPTKAGMIYAKRYAKTLLEEIDRPDDLKIRVTTVDKLKASGVTGEIWETA